MDIRLSLNLNQRLTLLQKLGLKSKHFDSCLVRTERLIQQSHYQKALSLLEQEGAGNYRGVLDWYCGTASPSWDLRIKAYYDGRCGRLIETVPFDEIDKMDQVYAEILMHLNETRKELIQKKVIRPHHSGDFAMRGAATQWVRRIAGELIPTAPPVEDRKVA
tara:strand:- start:2086 stop:2571 length:486 start_codon:yes stop_codon:yes gene_type:complete